MRAPLKLMPRKSREQRAHIRKNKHSPQLAVQEMSRVNLDMTKEERLRYLDWMRETARKHGFKTKGKFPYDGSFPDDQS